MRMSIALRTGFMCMVLAVIVPLALSQDPVPQDAAGSPAGDGQSVLVQEEAKLTLLQLILKGGPVMIPLGLASIIALGIAIERAVSLRRRRVIPEDFVSGLRGAMARDDGSNGYAVAYCEEAGGPVGDIFKAGMLRAFKGEEVVEKAIEDAAYREVAKLKRSLKGLAVIASVSPLMGLLGTVYGMIGAFQDATAAGMGKADQLAEGIYESLVTTATGLTIAIPTLLVYQYLASRVDALVDEIDLMCHDFMNACMEDVVE